MILAFDGDVIKFAGDSMIVAFSPTLEEVAGDPVVSPCKPHASHASRMQGRLHQNLTWPWRGNLGSK